MVREPEIGLDQEYANSGKEKADAGSEVEVARYGPGSSISINSYQDIVPQGTGLPHNSTCPK